MRPDGAFPPTLFRACLTKQRFAWDFRSHPLTSAQKREHQRREKQFVPIGTASLVIVVGRRLLLDVDIACHVASGGFGTRTRGFLVEN